MKVLTVVGARPQFIKAWLVSSALRKDHEEFLLHTGQHYDYEMSRTFFDTLELPEPDRDLEVGSGSHGQQTGAILVGVEQTIAEVRPDLVLVYGDTNSTLAGALGAVKLDVPVAHIEAGLRSRDLSMPEEVNRVCTDHISGSLLAPTQVAMENLASEGLGHRSHLVGDVMYEAMDVLVSQLPEMGEKLRGWGVGPDYILVTIHRPENTDDADSLRAIAEAMAALPLPVLLPMHPRTSEASKRAQIEWKGVTVIEPLNHLEMLALEREASLVVTDSGGVQKEAYRWGIPLVTIRGTTEWLETLGDERNYLSAPDVEAIKSYVEKALSAGHRDPPAVLSEGVANRIVEVVTEVHSP